MELPPGFDEGIDEDDENGDFFDMELPPGFDEGIDEDDENGDFFLMRCLKFQTGKNSRLESLYLHRHEEAWKVNANGEERSLVASLSRSLAVSYKALMDER
ncbi:hypothetical protein OIU84_023510 [Salix udensis]|uniref:Uncharacterized protein n=1 Tax=Salix udensis TaxID=889485 RepID=A0AAD6KR17_9ROSI|nr:hypothetical protein OIU84_023510 [Salix udensis]